MTTKTEATALSSLSTAAVVGLLAAGLGGVLVYGCTRLQTGVVRLGVGRGGTGEVDGRAEGAGRKGRKRKKGRAGVEVGDEVEGGGAKSAEAGDGREAAVPGDFESADAAMVQGKSKSKKKKKQKRKKQGKGADGDEDRREEVSETGEEAVADAGRAAAGEDDDGPRAGDSTDGSASRSPSVSVPGRASSRAVGKGSLRASTRPQPQPRGIRPSLSFDTDSSWMRVDHRRLRTSKSTDGLALDAVDVASSDLASTASESPVVERTDNVTADPRGPRADLVQRTLAEKLVPRPRKTAVDDMLAQPDFPTVARVMRVQPRADETPVPGFTWDDYGDVVEESVLLDDADQDDDDDGEWGVVKSRNRPVQITTATLASGAPETKTKKQRQNARKRELAKSAREEAEAARLQGLATHQREAERLRIIEHSQRGGGKQPGGGMKATVDERGKLVWE